MIQRDLFLPTPCPCGTGPACVERPEGFEITTWCLCPELVTFEAATLPEAMELWDMYLTRRTAA